MAYRRMSSLSLKCKEFLLETRGLNKSDRLYVKGDFSQYLTHGSIEMFATKLFPTYKTEHVHQYFVVTKDEFDRWERTRERGKKIIKLKSKLNA